ncbi:hypothetical protein ACHHYP_02328 [Achlya hypogyna]|uniref:Cyclic nucleotide-binding domain-containing protein n=1 Tax=Achlya hypogyna TaxID=1202772 RepID=A0A1V9Z787_ACHHY|nr:hypothetical protein ACHHYP_02328 [Achlya hypogyna]
MERPMSDGAVGKAAATLLRTCASAPNSLSQNARLVGRSWNFKAKQRRKYSIPSPDDAAIASGLELVSPTTAKLRGSGGRRFDITEDAALSFDELFQREMVKMPARMELASQADELVEIIQKADEAHRPRVLSPVVPPVAVSSEDAAKATLVFKFQCLLGRDVDLVHILPGYANNQLNVKMLALAQRYHAKHFAECFAELNGCWQINYEQINRPTLLFDRAILLGQMGEFKRAMVELNEAIKMDCEEPRFFKLRSILWRLQERYIEAAKDSTRAHTIVMSKSKNKHLSVVARKAVKAMTISGHASTKVNVFEEACETPIQERTPAQVQLLIDESNRIPYLARLDRDLLRVLWKNLSHVHWPTDTRVVLSSTTVSLYIVLEGSVAVQTELNGVKEGQRTLEPGSIFCEGSISANLWSVTSLIALTACKVLTLEAAIYKHTLRNIMLEGAASRANYFRETGIFASWTDEQLNTLGILSEQLEYGAQDTIVDEGAPATHLYFVKSGYCGAIRLLKQHPIQVGSVSSGDVFGEAAVLDPISGIFPFTIRALTICKVIRVEKNFLNKRLPFELLRLGAVDAPILAKIEKLSVRCPADKVLAQMIRDNCSWAMKRKNVLARIVRENSKGQGKHLLLPSIKS